MLRDFMLAFLIVNVTLFLALLANMARYWVGVYRECGCWGDVKLAWHSIEMYEDDEQ